MSKGVRLDSDLRKQFDTIMELHSDREIVAVSIPPEWYGGFKAAVGRLAVLVYGYGLGGDEACYEVSLPKEPFSTELGFMHLLGDDLHICWHSRKFKLVPEEGETGFNPLTDHELFDLVN